MAPAQSFVYIVTREDAEGGVSLLSAHATEKSANDAVKTEDGTAEVVKMELVGGSASKTKSPTPAGASKASAADKTRTTEAHAKKKSADAAPLPTADPHALADQVLCFSGELVNMKRKEAQDLAKAAGARVITSISKNCTLVVLGKDAGPKKLDQIEKLGIETVDEDEFLAMVKGDGSNGPAGAKRAADDEDDDEMDDEDEEEEPAPKKKGAKRSKA